MCWAQDLQDLSISHSSFTIKRELYNAVLGSFGPSQFKSFPYDVKWHSINYSIYVEHELTLTLCDDFYQSFCCISCSMAQYGLLRTFSPLQCKSYHFFIICSIYRTWIDSDIMLWFLPIFRLHIQFHGTIWLARDLQPLAV